MSRLILDIETVGRDLESLDEASRSYLLRWAKTEEEVQEVRESLSFYPLTGEIVAIGLLNPEKEKGAVYYQVGDGEPLLPFEEDGIRFETGTEKDILGKFWSTVKGYDEIVTFNGRSFDCPFILVRSAVHRIRPTKEIMPGRYDGSHIDLLDRLMFFGASRRRFSLDMWCRTFGIESPKAEFTGYEVKDIYRQGRYTDIARYCVGDLRATKSLLEYWERYMKFAPGAGPR
jgi:DNA polymerase elongation subunit (family B)